MNEYRAVAIYRSRAGEHRVEGSIVTSRDRAKADLREIGPATEKYIESRTATPWTKERPR